MFQTCAGNTTPHQPDYSPSPSSSPWAGGVARAAPRYSWAGDSEPGSAGNTPHYHLTPSHTPVYEGTEGTNVSSCETTPQHDNENNDPATPAAQHEYNNEPAAEEEAEAEVCQEFSKQEQ